MRWRRPWSAGRHDDLGDACASAADGTNPPSDLNGDADYRRHLARVLTRRAVLAALEADARMELTHDFTVPASVDDAWATFMDLERVGSCFPGATVTSVDESGFAGTVKVKLGPIALQYAGTGQFVERDDAAHRAVIEAKGKDKRGNGTAGATVTVQLAPSGEGTRIDVTTDLSVTGKPAQFGRGVMQDVSDKLLQQFVQCIEGQFARPPSRRPGPRMPCAGIRGPAPAAAGPGIARRGRRRRPAAAPAVAPGAGRSTAVAPGASGRRLDRPRGHGAAGARQELRAVRRGGAGRAGARLADRPPRLLSPVTPSRRVRKWLPGAPLPHPRRESGQRWAAPSRAWISLAIRRLSAS